MREGAADFTTHTTWNSGQKGTGHYKKWFLGEKWNMKHLSNTVARIEENDVLAGILQICFY